MIEATVPLQTVGALLRFDRTTGTLKERKYQVAVVAGPDTGLTKNIESKLVVGTHPDVGLLLKDSTVSRYHVELLARPDGVVVRDLDSTNGTYLGGTRVTEVIVEDQAVIVVGKTQLKVGMVEADLGKPQEQASFGPAIGASHSMKQLFGILEKVSPTDSTVLVLGETGTGKEVLARAIHEKSKRAKAPFVVVDCGAVAPTLIESELFGHVRGAFTGAVTEEQGLFRAARAGTLLLDEVAEIAIGLQANLLRVMEARQVRPVGSTRDIAIDVRVVATSNRELMALVQERSFRSDLYSRLAQWTIRLPPLRERREDIPSLTRSLLGRCDASGRAMTSDLAEALLLHDWPLNVRGLFNVLAIAAICAPSGVPLSLGAEVRSAMWTSRTLAVIPDEPGPLVVDKDGLEQLLGRFNGGVAAAARHLGITRPRLYRLLKVRGVEPAAFRNRG